MKIQLLCIGNTSEKYIRSGIAEYEKRLRKYCKFEFIQIPDIKNQGKYSKEEIKDLEADKLIYKINERSMVFLFDENGQEFSSIQFSQYLNKQLSHSTGTLVFIIGGAYGFSKKIYDLSKGKISLSQMTFSHQMVRMIALEQIYRAFTILNNEPYHHQ